MADIEKLERRAPQQEAPAETPLDAGSQALSEALRSSFGVVRVVMIILVLVFLGSGFFTVGPQERAIVLHLGKPVGEGEKALLGPGLHFSWPYPIDDHIKVSITGIQETRSRAGWYAVTPEQELAGTEPPAGATLNPAIDGYVLTADENIVHSRATLRYRISDPVRFVFNFVNASNAVQNALDDALLFAASHYKVDDVLTRDIVGFTEQVDRRVKQLVEEQNLGITVEQCTVQSVPPRQPTVKEAFANVLRAEVSRSKALTEAHSYENQVLSKASADAQSRINLAESDRARLVNDVSSRAEQFRNLLPKYEQNPELFKQQRLNEVVGRTLTNAQDKIFLAQGAQSKELRLLLNREPEKLKTEETKP